MANELEISISAEISGFQRGADAVSGRLDQLSAKYEQMGKDFSAVGKAMSIAITAPLIALGGLAVKSAAEIEGVRNAFERLNNADLLTDLRKATKGTVSDFELMKSAVNADNFALPVEKLGTLLEFARRRAKDTGQSVDYLVESLVGGIGKKSTQVLDNLGISATELNKELKGLSINAASIGEVTAAVERIANRSLGKMGDDVLTLQEQFLQIKASMANSLGDIGSIIAKMIQPLVGYIGKLASAFQNLSPEAKKIIVIVGAIVAAAGPLLVAFGALIAALPAISAGVAGLGAAFTLLTGPIGLVVAGIIAVAYAVYDNWDKIKPYILGTINYFIQLYNESLVLRVAIEGLAFAFKNAFAIIKNVLSTAWEVIKSFAKGVADSFAGVGKVIKGALNGSLSEMGQGFKAIGKATTSTWANVGNDIGNGIKDTFNDIKVNAISALDGAINGKKSLLTDLFGSTESDKTNAINTAVNDAGEVVDGIAGRLKTMQLPFIFNVNTDSITTNFEAVKAKIKEGLMTTSAAFVSDAYIAQLQMEAAALALSEGITNILNSGISSGIASAFEAIGGVMANGGDALSAVGASLLSSLGGILVEMGKMAITVGIGLLGIRKALTSLNPAVAIAAGAALVALGSFFSSKSKSIGGGMNSGGGGSSTGSAGGGSYSSPQSSGISAGDGSGGTVVFEISGQSLVGILSKTLDRNSRIGG